MHAPADIERVITRSAALPAAERLAIYQRAYHARLLECLREEFPILAQTLSQEVLDEFALGNLQQYPSRSYTSNRLGTNFPRYLEETRPQPDPEESSVPSWPDFLIDLATLELTFNEVFDGPGVEGRKLLGAEELLCVTAERWPEVRLVPVSCLRLLTLRYPVHDFHAAVRRKAQPPPPEPADTFLAITRRDYVVRHHSLSRPEYELLRALVGRQCVGDAIRLAAQAAGPDLDQLVTDVGSWFQAWSARGFFSTQE